MGQPDRTGPYVSPAQLCVGLYVHLDLPWSAHPFAFSSFKLRRPEQIDTLRALGLSRIRYAPERSDCAPDPLPSGTIPVPDGAPLAQAADDAARARQHDQLRAQLRAQQARTAACEQELVSAARTVRGFEQRTFSQPQAVHDEAQALVASLAASLLVDAAVSVRLMADRVAGEDVYRHGLNVALLGMMVARALKASVAQVHAVGLAALFHDMGELDVPDQVRRKAGAWTRAELLLMHQHVDHSVQVARRLGLPPDALHAIGQHHERADGSGYPAGLSLSRLPLTSRILAVVNSFDEACNPSPPKRGMTAHEALSLMFGQHSALYDPLVLNTLVRCMGVYPPGTVVQLSSGRAALVVSVNTSKPLRPVVLVYDPKTPRHDALLCDLAQAPALSVTGAMRPDQLTEAERSYLSPRARTVYFFEAAPEPVVETAV